MKIKLLVSRAGVGLVQNVGDVIDVPAEEGQRMIEAGQAEIVRSAAPEKAVARRKAERASK